MTLQKYEARVAELEAQRSTLESANTELREAAARCEAAEAEAKTATARAEAEAQAKTVAEGALSGVREELREAKLAAGESGADKAALVSPSQPQHPPSIESYPWVVSGCADRDMVDGNLRQWCCRRGSVRQRRVSGRRQRRRSASC